MYTPEARKLNLIALLMKVNSEDLLSKIEKLLKSNKASLEESGHSSIRDFAGMFTTEEATAMKQAIANTCEIIDADVWE